MRFSHIPRRIFLDSTKKPHTHKSRGFLWVWNILSAGLSRRPLFFVTRFPRDYCTWNLPSREICRETRLWHKSVPTHPRLFILGAFTWRTWRRGSLISGVMRQSRFSLIDFSPVFRPFVLLTCAMAVRRIQRMCAANGPRLQRLFCAMAASELFQTFSICDLLSARHVKWPIMWAGTVPFRPTRRTCSAK